MNHVGVIIWGGEAKEGLGGRTWRGREHCTVALAVEGLRANQYIGGANGVDVLN